METKVRLHRKNLKQAEFLKRQAEKERRELAKEDSDRSESKTSNENFRLFLMSRLVYHEPGRFLSVNFKYELRIKLTYTYMHIIQTLFIQTLNISSNLLFGFKY